LWSWAIVIRNPINSNRMGLSPIPIIDDGVRSTSSRKANVHDHARVGKAIQRRMTSYILVGRIWAKIDVLGFLYENQALGCGVNQVGLLGSIPSNYILAGGILSGRKEKFDADY
jgi:hypothetical protein